MISVSNKQELELCLDRSVISCGLREILAKAGIPESEPAKLSIKCGDTDVITDYEIPTTSPQVPVTPTEIDFEQEIKDFLDQSEIFQGLLSALPKTNPSPEGTTETSFTLTLTFDIGEPPSRQRLVRTHICDTPPPRHVC